MGFFLAALAVRLYFAHTLYLNSDECLHVNSGSSGQWSVYFHPPLLSWWLWAATLVSQQEWWLRLLPVVVGALTPVALGLWLRLGMHPITAWGVAAIVAFTPNLVLLSIQLRGYSMALFGIAAALYALDRAFADQSRRWLLFHFAALIFAILSEFVTAWIALAMGLYGLSRFFREPGTRRLVPVWAAGQAVGMGLYALLYSFILSSVTGGRETQYLIDTYLRAAFPQAGQNPLVFVSVGAFKQIVYIVGSIPGGAIAACFLIFAVVHWVRQRDSRLLIIAALGFAAVGGLAYLYPFGRSRHSVAIGMVTLYAIGAGIDMLSARWRHLRWAAPAALLAFAFLVPMRDINNPTVANWNKARWNRAVSELLERVPPGATILADQEALQMFQAQFAPRNDRFRRDGRRNTLNVKHLTLKARRWDWQRIDAEWVNTEAALASGSVWLLDTGFVVDTARIRSEELGAETVIDEPGVLYLSRLRP